MGLISSRKKRKARRRVSYSTRTEHERKAFLVRVHRLASFTTQRKVQSPSRTEGLSQEYRLQETLCCIAPIFSSQRDHCLGKRF